MQFKVIQGNRFWYQLKAHMPLCITSSTNLIAMTNDSLDLLFPLQIIGPIFAVKRGCLSLTDSFGVNP